MPYTFKKATSKELGKFFPFFKNSLIKQYPEYTLATRKYFGNQVYNLKNLRRWLKRKHAAIYLTIDGKSIIGYLMITLQGGGICIANWIAVHEKHQGKGIASKLLKMWELDAKRIGIHKLQLWTDKRNLKFYKNRGFKFVGKVPKNFYGSDDYLFYKTIQKPSEKNYLKDAKI